MIRRFGLLGAGLTHSRSPLIHSLLGNRSYVLLDRDEAGADELFRRAEFDGFNVTSPYKKTVVPYLSSLSAEAERTGSVNTVVKTRGGYVGYNTDYYGFSYMLKKSGVSVSGKKVAVLGNGGVAPTVRAVLTDAGAGEIVTVSRRGPVTYEDTDAYADAEIVVNATPVGMYPNVDASPVDFAVFTRPEALYDLVSNPLHTSLMMAAEDAGVPAFGGITMLCAQAVRSHELFLHRTVSDEELDSLVAKVTAAASTVFIIGMPGSGKTTTGRALAHLLSRPFRDTDTVVYHETGVFPSDLIKERGEAEFRKIETQALASVAYEGGLVVATGGGIVTVPENRRLMRYNGIVIYLDRPTEKLSTNHRPLSGAGLEELARKRIPIYRSWARATFLFRGGEVTAKSIKEAMKL